MGVDSPDKVIEQSKPNRYRIEAVDRALVLLEVLARTPDATASALAKATGANRSLTFRLLSTLVDRGFASKDTNNTYRLGPRLLHIGRQAQTDDILVSASKNVLDELAEFAQENVYLVVRQGTELVCIASRISLRPIRLSADVGTRGGLHTGGAAKVLLSFAPPDVIESVIEKHLHEFVPACIRTRAKAESVLRKIREDGFYAAIGELDSETYSLSAPIRDENAAVIAVLSIAGPISRLTETTKRDFIKRLKAASAEISQRLAR